MPHTLSLAKMYSFYVNLPIGGFSAALILLVFKTPKASRSEEAQRASITEKILQMDLIGTFVILAAVVCLLLALQWGGISKAWKSADVVGTLVGFCLIAILFVVVERLQGKRAMLVPHILKKRVIYVGCAFNIWYAPFESRRNVADSSSLGAAFFVLLYYIPIYFQAVLGVSAVDSGIRNLALIIATSKYSCVSTQTCVRSVTSS